MREFTTNNNNGKISAPELVFPDHHHLGTWSILGADAALFSGDLKAGEHAFVVQCCERLVSHLGVYNVWIALSRDGVIKTLASSYENGLDAVRAKMEEGWCPRCLDVASHTDDLVIIRNVQTECGDCPLASNYKERVGISCRIKYDGFTLGALRISAPLYMAEDKKLHSELTVAADQMGVILYQIAERERMENELQEQRRQLASLMSNLPGMAYRCRNDGDWTMEFVSEGCEALTGYSGEDLEYNRRISYGDLIHPEDRQKVATAVHAGIEVGKSFTVEYRITNARGDTRWVWERGRGACSGPHGELRIEGFITDITDRLHLARKMQELVKHESLSVMAAGVAHDFNNILSAILGHAEIAAGAATAESGARENLEQIIKSSRKAAALCRQMLSFCGKNSEARERIAVNPIIEGMQSILSSGIPKNIELKLDLSADAADFMGDLRDARQVLLELVKNAAESYQGRGGVVCIESSTIDYVGKPGQGLVMPENPAPGRYVCIGVRDQGCGMDAATQSKMFDPFFSTKFTGRGMSLPALLGIVRSLQGFCTVISSPGRGTSMRVMFPALPAIAREAGDAPSRPTQKVGRARTVLVADDDVTLGNLCRKLLMKEDCIVTLVKNGREAVEAYRAAPGGFDLVILDLTMPELNGADACEQICAMNPNARVALMTGYSAEDIGKRLKSRNLAGILLKPFGRDDLRALIAPVAS